MTHQFGGLDLRPRRNDLGLANPLRLCGHTERLLEFIAEDYILDEHALDVHTPSSRDIFDDLADGLRNLLTALNDILQQARADDMTEGSLRALYKRGANVADAKGGFVWTCDIVVNDGGEIDGDVILCHTDLLGNFHNLDLYVDFGETFAEWVDAREAWVDGASKAAEFGDQAHVALFDGLVGVGTNNAAGNCAAKANDRAEGVDLIL